MLLASFRRPRKCLRFCPCDSCYGCWYRALQRCARRAASAWISSERYWPLRLLLLAAVLLLHARIQCVDTFNRGVNLRVPTDSLRGPRNLQRFAFIRGRSDPPALYRHAKVSSR